MKLTKSQLKEMVKEVIKEGRFDDDNHIRNGFYKLGDAIENMSWLNMKNTTLNKDKTVAKIVKQMMRLQNQLENHFNKNYQDWD